MGFWVSPLQLQTLCARWEQEARQLREGSLGYGMSSDEALSVAAQLEQCAEDLANTVQTQRTWVA